MSNISTYNGSCVYHGGVYVVDKIDLSQSKIGSDFGIAFYLTSSKIQAESWARSKHKRSKTKDRQAVVCQYEIKSFENLNYIVFDEANEEWLDFIVANRTNYTRTNAHDYDVVIGPVADDETQVVIDNYIAGIYSHYGHLAKEIALKFLEPWKLKNQIALCTQMAVNRVSYIGNYCL